MKTQTKDLLLENIPFRVSGSRNFTIKYFFPQNRTVDNTDNPVGLAMARYVL